jgi:transposase
MHPLEIRYKAVIHYKYFLHSLRKVANHYNVSKSSLQRWIKNDPKPSNKRERYYV